MMAMGLQSQMESVILDEGLPTEIRHEAFNYFGTFSRSFLSLFEVILGNWVPLARFMSKNVDEIWGYFILFLRISVDFSVVRVVGAVIMHETFRCASLDDELMIQTRDRSQNKFAHKMRMLFDEADSTGDGSLSFDEFRDIVGDKRVRMWLAAMDLNVRDPEGVFSYLVSQETFRQEALNGDEEVSFEELIRGLARLRGPSLSCDVLSIMADMKVMTEKLEQNRDSMQRLLQLTGKLATEWRRPLLSDAAIVDMTTLQKAWSTEIYRLQMSLEGKLEEMFLKLHGKDLAVLLPSLNGPHEIPRDKYKSL